MTDPAGEPPRGTNLGAAAAMALVATLVWVERSAVLVLFAGLLLAVLLRTVSEQLERRTKLGSIASVLVVLGLVLALFVVALWSRGTAIAEQFEQLQARLPIAIQQVVGQIQSHEFGRWLLSQLRRDQAWSSGMFSRASGIISATVRQIVAMFIVLFIGTAVAAEPHLYVNGLVRLFPPRHRTTVCDVLAELGRTLRYWLLARAISMCVVGAVITAGLLVLKVPLALTFGMIAALLTFIPNLGPILSAIPPALLAFVGNPSKAAAVILLFCGAHMLEGFLITPLAERRAVRLAPALTFSVQVVMAVIAGAIGVALAAPLTVVGIVIVRTVYIKRLETGQGTEASPEASPSKLELHVKRTMQTGS